MRNPYKGRTGVDRILHAARYSAAGLAAAWRHESAFRQELLLALPMLPASFWLGATWGERALLAGTVLLVLIVELLNSGIEATIDRISLERHELSGRAKDYGSAAVMLALLLCGATWAAALWARFGPA
ncbi:MAG TPA: diacylglycerol kinase [Rubrivivax sp.]|nr:diacylglycerol kinase [Burkholderiales bacterium]HNU11971.1 diacylglycerol kinase [Rubrivivax sp.]